MYLITYVDRVNISTAADAIRTELALSNTQLGFLQSAFGYPYLLFQIFGGWIGDRFGPRRTLFLCGLIWATRDHPDRIRRRSGDAVPLPSAGRRRRRRDVPGRDARDAELDAARPPRLRAGLTHAFARLGNADHAADRRLADRRSSRGAGRSSRSAAAAWCGSLIWFWYFRDNPAEHPAITRDELDALPNQRRARENVAAAGAVGAR